MILRRLKNVNPNRVRRYFYMTLRFKSRSQSALKSFESLIPTLITPTATV